VHERQRHPAGRRDRPAKPSQERERRGAQATISPLGPHGSSVPWVMRLECVPLGMTCALLGIGLSCSWRGQQWSAPLGVSVANHRLRRLPEGRLGAADGVQRLVAKLVWRADTIESDWTLVANVDSSPSLTMRGADGTRRASTPARPAS